MVKQSASGLASKPAAIRYLYFVLSSLKLKSFKRWREDGEPNPFVGKSYRRAVTERVEFDDIFGDVLHRSGKIRSRTYSASR